MLETETRKSSGYREKAWSRKLYKFCTMKLEHIFLLKEVKNKRKEILKKLEKLFRDITHG